MNVLINTQSYYARNAFVNALMPSGITLYHTDNPVNVINEIQQHLPEIVILDVIQEDYKRVFELVKKIKNHTAEEVKKTAVILLIGSIDKEEITSAIKAGVVGFIKSNASVEVIYKHIMDTYQKVRGFPANRKFVRVKMEHDDNISISFRSSSSSQLILGQITSISLGGIAIDLVGTFSSDNLSVGSEVKNMRFLLDGKGILIDGEVVAYRNNNCALRFNDMTAETGVSISQYIFKKIFNREV
jgi:DNA-binding NarL/FixJ family response regulator